MTDLQTEIAEVEKLMNDADLKDLKEKTAGVEAEIKRYEKQMADANNEIEGLHQRIDFINTTIKSHNDTIERSLANNKELELDKAKFVEEIKSLKSELEVLDEQIKEITEKLGELFLNNIKGKVEIIYEGSSKKLFELIKDRYVCVSHQTQNDFHYYGDSVDKFVKDVWEESKIISDNVNFVAQCLEDNVILNSKK